MLPPNSPLVTQLGNIYGVFDGHAGSAIAYQLASELPDLIASYLKPTMTEIKSSHPSECLYRFRSQTQ